MKDLVKDLIVGAILGIGSILLVRTASKLADQR